MGSAAFVPWKYFVLKVSHAVAAGGVWVWKGCKRHRGNQAGFPDVENARAECSELLLWELSAELLSQTIQ